MAIIPQSLDYTDRDFASLRARLFNIISRQFPNWTDTAVSNYGNILVELFAFTGGTLTYYQDRHARESRLSDAVLRSSVLKIAKMLGYTPAAAGAASTVVTVTLDRPPVADLIIPSSFRVFTADVTSAVKFRLSLPTTILVGTDPGLALATCVHSETEQDTFTSTSLPEQAFKLTAAPFVDNTEAVIAGGQVFTRVSSLFGSSATDAHYALSVGNDNKATVTFGNGVAGLVPSGDIIVDYEVGGGKAGNVEVGTLTRPQPATLSDTQGNNYTVTTTNQQKAAGGLDRETISAIKQRAPLSARLNQRTVALEDYELGAEDVAGVARALMATSDQVAGIPENRGQLFIVPEGGGLPTQILKDQVLEAVTITRPNTITFQLTVLDPLYLTVNISARVFISPGFTETATRSNIEAALTELFAIRNSDGTVNMRINFGLKYQLNPGDLPEIPLSDITNAIIDSAGVRKLGDSVSDMTANGVHKDVTLGSFDFPLLGTITLRNGDSGNLF